MPTDIQALLSRYDEAYRANPENAAHYPAPIEWGKDTKLAKQLLERYTLEQLTPLLEHYFVIEDEWIAKSGYTFGVFYKVIGKVITDFQRVTAKQAKQAMFDDYKRQRQARSDRELLEYEARKFGGGTR